MRRRTKILAILIGVILVLAGITFQISKARCWQLVGEVTCRVDTSRRIVALTFDDGPTPEGVDAVLPILDRYGVKATFFLIGNQMAKYSGLAERLSGAGHELGNHSYSHRHNVMKSRGFYRDEVRTTDALLRRAGAHARLFRPPYGKRLIGLPIEVEAAGYRSVTWDVEEPDRFEGDPEGFAQAILSQVRPGSIILIHPMYRRNQTARDALPLVLRGLQAMGYAIVPVGRLLEMVEAAT